MDALTLLFQTWGAVTPAGDETRFLGIHSQGTRESIYSKMYQLSSFSIPLCVNHALPMRLAVSLGRFWEGRHIAWDRGIGTQCLSGSASIRQLQKLRFS